MSFWGWEAHFTSCVCVCVNSQSKKLFRLLKTQVAVLVKNPTCQCRRLKIRGFNPWVGKILWRREWQPPPVFLTWRESHGQRSLAGYNPWGDRESDTTEVTLCALKA